MRLTKGEVEDRLKMLKGWKLDDDEIEKKFEFKDFKQSMEFVNMVADAQRSRAPIQKVADSVARYFVPAVVLTAIATFLVWAIVQPAQPALLAPRARLAQQVLPVLPVQRAPPAQLAPRESPP